MNNLNAQIREAAELIKACARDPRETLAGTGSDRYFAQAIYPFMGKIAKDKAAELMRREAYLPYADVNAWYDNASDGEREHMANKLAKAGYPQNGKHSEYGIQKAAIKRFIADINNDIEELI